MSTAVTRAPSLAAWTARAPLPVPSSSTRLPGPRSSRPTAHQEVRVVLRCIDTGHRQHPSPLVVKTLGHVCLSPSQWDGCPPLVQSVLLIGGPPLGRLRNVCGVRHPYGGMSWWSDAVGRPPFSDRLPLRSAKQTFRTLWPGTDRSRAGSMCTPGPGRAISVCPERQGLSLPEGGKIQHDPYGRVSPVRTDERECSGVGRTRQAKNWPLRRGSGCRPRPPPRSLSPGTLQVLGACGCARLRPWPSVTRPLRLR